MREGKRRTPSWTQYENQAKNHNIKWNKNGTETQNSVLRTHIFFLCFWDITWGCLT
jgi:hypothetical protein